MSHDSECRFERQVQNGLSTGAVRIRAMDRGERSTIVLRKVIPDAVHGFVGTGKEVQIEAAAVPDVIRAMLAALKELQR